MFTVGPIYSVVLWQKSRRIYKFMLLEEIDKTTNCAKILWVGEYPRTKTCPREGWILYIGNGLDKVGYSVPYKPETFIDIKEVV